MRNTPWLAIVLLFSAGCVQRTMSIQTDPPGALVYLNGEEFGRTPLQRDFVWYGTYDLEIRKEGFETLKSRQKVIAPWWQWVPFDLVAEFFPANDQRSFSYKLTPAGDPAIDEDQILARSGALKAMLESSQAPTAKPAK